MWIISANITYTATIYRVLCNYGIMAKTTENELKFILNDLGISQEKDLRQIRKDVSTKREIVKFVLSHFNSLEEVEEHIEEIEESISNVVRKTPLVIDEVTESDLVVFTRRSNSSQSRYGFEEVKKAIYDRYEACTIIFADDSSSFKDAAFMAALEYVKMHGKSLRVYSFSRTELETITRSAKLMTSFTDYVQKNLLLDVEVQGMNLFYQSELVVFLTAQNEPQWLFKANTKYYPKHELYLEALESSNFEDLSEIQNRELVALIKYNRGVKPTIQYLQALKAKSSS